jgi:hypothetical protein
MRYLFYIALTGLILSIIVHILSFTGLIIFLNEWKEFVFFLHGGAILLGLPIILSMQKIMIGRDRKGFRRVAFENCPVWMRKLISLCMTYGFLSVLIIGWFFTSSNKSDPPFRFFSGGWIIFYSLEMGVFYSYLHSPSDK